MNFSHNLNPDYWAMVYGHGSIGRMIMEASRDDEEPESSTPRTFQDIDDDYEQ